MRDASHSSCLTGEVPIVLFVESMQVGGTAAYATEVALHLQQRGQQVAVICGDVRDDPAGPLSGDHYVERLRQSGIAVDVVAKLPGSSLQSRVRRIRSLLNLLGRYKRPVVLLMMGYFDGGGPATLAARLRRARAVVRAELQPPMPPVGMRERLAARARDLLVDRLVVGAEQNRQALKEIMGRSPRKVRVIHTGLDVSRYVPGRGRGMTRARLGYGEAELVVAVMARLVERKGVSDFLRMAEAVTLSHPQARFLIVGDGPDRSLLESQAAEAGITSAVRFTGTRNDVPELLAATDVFVVPSHDEGGPLVLLEAMAMALPVVTTRVGLVPEVVEPAGTGLVVEARDVSAMAGAVRALLSDGELREQLGSLARAHAEQAFTLEAMVDAYLRLCADVARL